MKNLAKEHNIKLKYEPVIQTILRLPDILKVERQELAAEEWNIVSQGVADAIKQFNEFRIQEGMALQKDFERQISTISKRLDAVEPYEKERIETVKARLTEAFADLSNQPDPDRFQQEVIFYLEKLDVTRKR